MIDLPTDGSIVVADVEAGDWSLRITRHGEMYGAVLAGPVFGDGLEIRLWPSLPRVKETVAFYLTNRGLTHVWIALRANLDAETRS